MLMIYLLAIDAIERCLSHGVPGLINWFILLMDLLYNDISGRY